MLQKMSCLMQKRKADMGSTWVNSDLHGLSINAAYMFCLFPHSRVFNDWNPWQYAVAM